MYALVEVIACLALLALFGASGMWLLAFVMPPRVIRPFAPAAAPLLGLIIVPLAVDVLYRSGLSFAAASWTAFGVLGAVTLLHRRRLIAMLSETDVLAVAAAFVLATIVSPALVATAGMSAGGAAIDLIDGSDSLGYATDADWLYDHRVTELPPKTTVYGIIPYQNLRLDQRLSAFDVVAVARVVTGQPSLFALPIAAAAAFAAGVLGLAALAAANRRAFAVTLAGVAISQLFDYAHDGFFAKLLGQPATLAVVVLALQNGRRLRLGACAGLALLTAGASVLHSFATTMTVLAVALAASLAYGVLSWRRRAPAALIEQRNVAIVLAGLVVVSYATTGGLVVLLGAVFTDWQRFPLGLAWPCDADPARLLQVALDLDFGPRAIPWLTGSERLVLTAAAIVSQAVLAVLALRRRVRTAFVLLAGPATFVAAIVLPRPWGALQLAGIGFVACAIGIGLLLSADTPSVVHPASRTWRIVLATAVGAALLARVPRAAFVLNRYVAQPRDAVRYTAAEFDGVARAVGGRIVAVDVPGVLAIQPLVVELGRRGIDIRFAQNAWIFDGWGLADPPGVEAAGARIVAPDAPSSWPAAYRGAHYRVDVRPSS